MSRSLSSSVIRNVVFGIHSLRNYPCYAATHSHLRYQSFFNTRKESETKPEDGVKSDQTQQQQQHSSDEKVAATKEDVMQVQQILKSENDKLIEKIKELDDKFKRALAETENTRIRMQKQVEDAKMFGIQAFCKDLLDIADVLEKAIETVPNDEVQTNASLKNLLTGVEMTEKQLQGVFKRHGLLQINPVGEKFNPNEHHAMFETEDPQKEPGTVAVVTKIGYKLQNRTIRPAMVGVIKSPSQS